MLKKFKQAICRTQTGIGTHENNIKTIGIKNVPTSHETFTLPCEPEEMLLKITKFFNIMHTSSQLMRGKIWKQYYQTLLFGSDKNTW